MYLGIAPDHQPWSTAIDKLMNPGFEFSIRLVNGSSTRNAESGAIETDKEKTFGEYFTRKHM